MNNITLLSPAKVNLTLEILGKRPDGYHEIRSIMQPVNIFDEIKIEIFDGVGIEIQSKGLKLPSGDENLAWRASDLFLKESRLSFKVRISIKKTIPLGAGLGGGSSNAGAVLVGLNKITKKLTQDELLKTSAKIGADVALFINCRSAIAEGIGEQITVIRDFPLFHYLIINPGFEVSTRKIYEQWEETDKEELRLENIENTISMFRNGKFPLWNDLEKAAIGVYPEIKQLKDRLIDIGARAVSMTGSGPTVFAAFKEKKEASIIYNYIKDSSKFKVYLVKGISGWHRL
ncbi:4-(cytidine 5'-diphospho)-2-C-methyl-D-erythritol kinase [Desulfobacterota bacterium AH_259_B03_O07]|nr:4-(cytidine 5'-diphospho)-2-C-methyl-D-erythritol kinase [Desulfobacterota bacterium AH_259_B03_O07]